MTLLLDWWQLGWAFAGFLLIMFFALFFATRNHVKKGWEQGYHDRQHWEGDEMLKAMIRKGQ